MDWKNSSRCFSMSWAVSIPTDTLAVRVSAT
jgi:hypothetical protein